jgi:hypothetical protein
MTIQGLAKAIGTGLSAPCSRWSWVDGLATTLELPGAAAHRGGYTLVLIGAFALRNRWRATSGSSSRRGRLTRWLTSSRRTATGPRVSLLPQAGLKGDNVTITNLRDFSIAAADSPAHQRAPKAPALSRWTS